MQECEVASLLGEHGAAWVSMIQRIILRAVRVTALAINRGLCRTCRSH
jgi:hypothetical protein